MKKIFLIAGKGRQGKDTVASYIQDYYNNKNYKTINLNVSYYLKDYAKRITNWSGSEEDKPREFLQELGTTLIRDKIDEEFFIKRLLEDIEVFSYFYDIITISDIRLPLEIEKIKEKYKDSILIHIVRLNYENSLTKEEQKHRTETSLDNYTNYDYEIINDKTLEDLKEKTINILERVKL